MKKYNFKVYAPFLIAVLTLFTACKKDFQESKKTFWPDIKINGSKLVFSFVNDVYTDQAATVTVNGAAIDYDTDNSVDVTTPGAYFVTYTAINEDGIAASDQRTVVIVDTASGLNTADLSGSFTRVGQAGSSLTWTKDTDHPYTYIANNPGGVPPSSSAYAAHNEAVYNVFNVASGLVSVPEQSTTTLAPFYCQTSGGDLQIPFNTAAVAGDVAYVWVVVGANFGAAARTFRKL